MKIILASQSKRRQELLKQIGLNYEVVVSSGEEIFDSTLAPIQNCINVSYEKALEVSRKTKGDRIIISCDTIVVKDNLVIGKPKDEEDAYRILSLLSGTSHEVISCLTVLKIVGEEKEEYKTYDKSLVYFDNLTKEEMDDWIKNHNPYDKAGGYAIQESFAKHIVKIEGDYYSIVGLPLNKLYQILKEIN